MSSSLYNFRNPKDKTSYIAREDLIDRVNRHREWYKKYAHQQDMELILKNTSYLAPQYKENLVVSLDGQYVDISQYRKPQYLLYNGNNPAWWQGDNIVMSTRGLYGNQIDEQYKKTRDIQYIKSKRRHAQKFL